MEDHLICESLTADLLPKHPQREARHYDVSRAGELVGRISCRPSNHPLPSPGWWVWVEEEAALLKNHDAPIPEVRYFKTPEDALSALNQHLKDWVTAALDPNPTNPAKGGTEK